jgi:hypothetical protein
LLGNVFEKKKSEKYLFLFWMSKFEKLYILLKKISCLHSNVQHSLVWEKSAKMYSFVHIIGSFLSVFRGQRRPLVSVFSSFSASGEILNIIAVSTFIKAAYRS